MADSSVCIECGHCNSLAVYREFKPGAIQLNQCIHCSAFIDKYVEYDKVILMLDIFLLRMQSYRHMIFNYDISSTLLWRLYFVLILCKGYVEFQNLNELIVSDLSRVHFLLSLGMSVIETTLTLILTTILLYCFNGTQYNRLNCNFILRLVIISNFINFCAVVAMIWVDSFYVQFLLFLSVPAQLQVYRALLPSHSHWFKPLLMVLAQVSVLSLVHYMLVNIILIILEQILIIDENGNIV